jgi:diaminopimelate epimerase
MSALANRDFVKMNGLGNEILIVDLRRAPRPISAAEARRAPRAMAFWGGGGPRGGAA